MDDRLKDALELQEVVKEFFNRFLNRVEDSDDGKPFNPVMVSCSRALMIQPLSDILERMRVLSGANPNPLYEETRMPDITMCMGGDCPLKQDCYRYTAKPSQYLQSYFGEIPYDTEAKECDSFLDNRIQEENNK
jgi:hypothetical protein